MRTKICDRLDLEYPIFGFSHCRDVVAAISRAGGMGVLGTSHYTPEQLEMELRWLDENSAGKPYGLDVIMPAKYESSGTTPAERGPEHLKTQIPQQHWDFLDSLLQEFGVDPLPEGAEAPQPRRHGSEDAREALALVHGHDQIRL